MGREPAVIVDRRMSGEDDVKRVLFSVGLMCSLAHAQSIPLNDSLHYYSMPNQDHYDLLAQPGDTVRFDLLKRFTMGQTLFYHYEIGVEFRYLPDTLNALSTFHGSREISIDSILVGTADSTRIFYLTIHTVGTEVIRTSARAISSRAIDSSYSTTINEEEGSRYRAGNHKLKGWIFPDSLPGYSRRCPYDGAKIYYPYLSYFRYYDCPSLDTFDVRNDTLALRTLYTDCYDFADKTDYYVTLDSGLIGCSVYIFNWLDHDWWADLRLVKITGMSGSQEVQPASFALSQNYPNPFNPSTIIRYQLPNRSFVTLKVFDVLGREVAALVHQYESAGPHSVRFNGAGFPSGVYFYRLQAETYYVTKKCLLLR